MGEINKLKEINQNVAETLRDNEQSVQSAEEADDAAAVVTQGDK